MGKRCLWNTIAARTIDLTGEVCISLENPKIHGRSGDDLVTGLDNRPRQFEILQSLRTNLCLG